MPPYQKTLLLALATSARLGRNRIFSRVVASAEKAAEKRVWLFGYGSLTSESSRKRTSTALTGESFPALVSGLSRGWFTSLRFRNKTCARISAMQALGVTPVADVECSGIIFGARECALKEFDVREQRYKRIQIEWAQVHPMGNASSEQKEEAESLDEKFYCYIPRDISRPSREFPVIQSYVDVILDGCMQISRQYVREFLRTTSNWPKCPDGSYLNDRAAPAYVRYSDDASKKAGIWDSLLREELPRALEVRLRPNALTNRTR